MKLAIVIPYYKLSFFEEVLQSLASQTDKRFNVYIGDDASPENPEGLLEKYKEKLNLKYIRFENNLGKISLVKQWERCIDLINNEDWVMILGDDDYLGNNVIKFWYDNFKLFEGKSNVIRFASCKINEISVKTSKVCYSIDCQSSVDFLFNHERNSLSEYIFKKDQIIKIGFQDFPLAWCSDTLAVFEFSLTNHIYAINSAVVYIRITSLSISGKNDNNKLKNIASEEFSEYIILNYYYLFNRKQRISLLFGYEYAMKRNKSIKKGDWCFLLNKHFKNFNILQILKFIFRFLKFNLNNLF